MYKSIPYTAVEIYSTVEDLYRCNKDLNKMFTPYMNNYGYWWYIANKNNDKIVFHSWCILGYISYILRDINKKCVIIVLSNDNNAGTKIYNITSASLDILKAGN